MCRHAVSRRDFFRDMVIGLSGMSILGLAARRAAWAQAAASGAATDLFEIQNVGDGVYFAFARPQAVGNCNAAIFVNSADVLVVDSHSKPSAAAGLIAQIKNQVTTKPVRYLVDTHFHWDHVQGNRGYREAFGKDLKIISSVKTKQLEAEFVQARLRETLDPHGHPFSSQPHIPVLLDAARQQLSAASSEEEKARLAERIRQLQAFEREMQNFQPVFPTVTFSKTHVIKDKAHELHVEFHGRAHTAGDVVVYCPQKRVVATGDMVLGTLPFMGDCFPEEWSRTIDSVARLDFDRVCGGHGTVGEGKQRMISQRNYIAELAERVRKGKEAGMSVAEIQKSMPLASIKAFAADGYGALMSGGRDAASMQTAVNTNIEHVFNRLGIG
jgi:glyoxylase-like metal-dependent hydrolase (beta-lactamase superfamily II)